MNQNSLKIEYPKLLLLLLTFIVPSLLKKYFVPVLAGFIIASPMPDEIGVSMLVASRSISTKVFSIISFILNTTGIFGILLIGSLI